MGMSSISGIARGYFATLVSQRSGKPNKRAILFQIGLPFLLGVLVFAIGWTLDSVGNIINAVAIVAALLCAVATLLFQVRIDLRARIDSSDDPFIGENDLLLVDELFSTLLWAILFGFAIVGCSLVVDWSGALKVTNPLYSRVAASVAAAAIAHLAFVIGTILKRLRRIYEIVAVHKR